MKIAVIGGGITGVTTAYALSQRGLEVTLFERHRYPAMETSFANGGQLSASHAEAWNSWSNVRKGLGWMLRADAPLLIRPAPSWHKLSWFGEFLRAIPRYRDTTVAIARLAVDARACLFDWAHAESIDFDSRREGILHVCRDKAGFEHAAGVSSLLAQGGLQRRAVTPLEMRAIEPALQGAYYGGFFTESDSSGDIHKFTSGLAAASERRGVRILCEREVIALAAGGAQGGSGGVAVTVRHADTVDALGFDAVVICAGTASRALAAMLGDRVNVYPVKGYSITVKLNDPSSRAAAPTVSLVDDAHKLVASRFGEDRYRVAGTAEFAGLDRDIRADRVRPLTEWVQNTFPGVSTKEVIPWAGLRPMMPDMLPRVGKGRREGVFYNTGHGHLGWTLSAATAEIVADMVAQSAAMGYGERMRPSSRAA
ncbi:D-amino acid dehydrogenase [Pseudoduganella sp. UC29_106]|uniref:D-amino acid dehydrogenase n=1 Tax=Pseudoduganella sp. UC29_106 TaxID=3374553 RepID=UPI0037582E48